ncbi:MAG TPA: tetratricopeptide repeat protein [Gemmatimonadaceae bacterium]|nr:tetratricopeptide repeat protein [Gemmatimonadaceae bacterium]
MQLDHLLQAALGPSYVVERELGGGGMSRVFVASEPSLGRRVVVKVLPPELAVGVSRERFRREMQFVAQLQHPNIVPLLMAAEGQGLVYYAMPYVEGESLRGKLKVTPQIPLAEALVIATEVADALAYAHRSGVVHRDIKPENILISEGHAVVADFGIARALSAAAPDAATTSGMRVGTPAYMSPEQALGEDVDARTDIYSLGCVLYEMVAGRLPFSGENAQAMLAQRMLGPPPRLHAFIANAPAALDDVLERTLAPDPNDRFASSFELFDALRSVLIAPLRAPVEAPRTGGNENAWNRPGHTKATNLPLPATPLIGRERERESVVARLNRDDVRLLTITGPGGVGKTRLAVEVARALLPCFRDGVFIVPLADSTDPAHLASAIAHAIGVTVPETNSPMTALSTELAARQLLLLLDNFEQLLAAAADVGDLLGAAPELKIIVTSQAPLRIRAEHEFALTTLSVPASTTAPAAELGTYGAVQLYVQRARAVNAAFAPVADDLRAIAEICARLDGLPLAIELAAARSKILPPRVLVGRLRSGLELAASGARDLPERQQTIRAAIEWSFNLLDPGEQGTLMQLSAFSRGCTIDAAEAVCDSGREGGTEVLQVIASLVDKSLLAVDHQARTTPRFVLLQAIRHYGLERLRESGAEEAVRRRHANYFVTFAVGAEPHLAGAESDVWLDGVEAEHENLRAAFDYLVAGREDSALRLSIALWRFWITRGFAREGLERMLAALDACEHSSSDLRTKALYAAGVLADTLGDYERGRNLFEDALTIFRRTGDKWGVANSLNNLGVLAVRRGDRTGARQLYEESLELWRELDNRPVVALSLTNLGNVAMSDGDHARADALYRESLELFRSLGDGHGVALALGHRGDLERARGRLDEACTLYEDSFAIYEQLGNKAGAASAAADRGDTAIDARDPGSARQFLEAALSLYGDLGDTLGIARVLERFAALAAVEGHSARAIQIIAAAGALRTQLGVPLSEHEAEQIRRRLIAATEKLSESESAAAAERGSSMSVAQAIEFALG